MAGTNKRTLGKTNIEITPIGLGVMQFAGGSGTFRFMYQSVSDTEMNAIIQAALDGGINWFDTAEMYGKGRSEEGLSRGLQAAGRDNDDVVIATKWWPLGRTAGSISKTISDRIRHLAPYTIDLHQVHWSFGFSSVEKEMEAMADLVEAGKIRIGGHQQPLGGADAPSARGPEQAKLAAGLKPDALQPAQSQHRKQRSTRHRQRARCHDHQLFTPRFGIAHRQISQGSGIAEQPASWPPHAFPQCGREEPPAH